MTEKIAPFIFNYPEDITIDVGNESKYKIQVLLDMSDDEFHNVSPLIIRFNQGNCY